MNTLIPICNKYALSADTNSWSLSKKVKGEWRQFQYYLSIEAALRGLLDLKLRTSGAQSATELCRIVQRGVSEIKQAMEPVGWIEVRLHDHLMDDD